MPISESGFKTRPIGRTDNEASPVNFAVRANPDAAPIIRRTPVPALPQSTSVLGVENPASPHPVTFQRPSFCFSTLAPKLRIAPAVDKISAPSSSPVIIVSPSAKAPKISALCEIDLSPGALTVPIKAGLRCELAVILCPLNRFAVDTMPPVGKRRF